MFAILTKKKMENMVGDALILHYPILETFSIIKVKLKIVKKKKSYREYFS